MSSGRKRVAVLGATGVAGQQFLVALDGHPQFELVKLGASERSAGKRYEDAIRDGGHLKWYCRESLPPAFAGLTVEEASKLTIDGVDIVFSAVESDAARSLEAHFAAHLPVFSTASAFRYEADVPILLPGVNPEHAQLLQVQKKNRGWKGFVAPGPNCTTTGMAITLKPLDLAFGIEQVVMTSMQAVSGSGRSPGVAALDITDNIIPYIAKEEEKVEKETKKILGRFESAGSGAAGITSANIGVSCTCTRVAVLDGHTECVYVGLKKKGTIDEVKRVLREFGVGLRSVDKLHSAPERLIEVLDDPYRPQPRLDRDAGEGMTTVVGRLREETTLAGAWGVKYVLVSHNTRMGAAKGVVLTAESLLASGQLD